MKPHKFNCTIMYIWGRTYPEIEVLLFLDCVKSVSFLFLNHWDCVHQRSHLTEAPPTQSTRITGS